MRLHVVVLQVRRVLLPGEVAWAGWNMVVMVMLCRQIAPRNMMRTGCSVVRWLQHARRWASLAVVVQVW